MKIARLSVVAMALAIACSGLTSAGAQGMREQGMRGKEGHMAPALRDLKLEQAEIDKIEEALKTSEEAIVKARAEIQVIQARIARLMLDREPSMEQTGALVKESLDWEYKIRMAQIGRQIAIRQIVGDERWVLMFRMAREFRQVANPRMMMELMDRNGMSRKDVDKWTKLLLLLRRLN
jgi:hypothetical protein